LALCSLENKDARARFGILKGLHSARRGRISVTTLRRISQNGEQSEQTARPGHTRGERSPPARGRPEHERRQQTPGPRGAPEGLDSTTRHCPTSGSDERRRDITGNDPKVTPSKRNSESSGRFRRDRSVDDGLRLLAVAASSSHQGVKGGHPSAGIRERPSSQCSTG
jgi:hypothetical protein